VTDLNEMTVEEKLKYYSRMNRNVTAELARLRRKQQAAMRDKKSSYTERIDILASRKMLLQLEKEEILIQCKRESILEKYPWIGQTIHTNIFTTYDPTSKT